MNNSIPIESVRRFSAGATFWGLLGVASLGAGLALGNMHLILICLAPLMLAMGLWFFRLADFRGELSENGIRIEDPAQEISFENIQNLTLAGKPQDPEEVRLEAGPLIVVHNRGVLEIPASLNLPVKELYKALFASIPKSGSRSVHQELFTHLQNEESIFVLIGFTRLKLGLCRGADLPHGADRLARAA